MVWFIIYIRFQFFNAVHCSGSSLLSNDNDDANFPYDIHIHVHQHIEFQLKHKLRSDISETSRPEYFFIHNLFEDHFDFFFIFV